MRKSCDVVVSDCISDVMGYGRIEVLEKQFERGFQYIGVVVQKDVPLFERK